MSQPAPASFGKFPTDQCVAFYNGVFAVLGWNKPYTRNQVVTAIDNYANDPSSGVAPDDRDWLRNNFVHTSTDHPDMLLFYYGVKAAFNMAVSPHTVTYSPAK
jgi:hypothetical protein